MKRNATIRQFILIFSLLLYLGDISAEINEICIVDNSPDSWALICPNDVTVSCDAELWDLSIYGDAYIQIHYHNYPAGSPTVKYYLNSCGTGYITRTWTEEDPNWNWISCTQVITVGNYGGSGHTNIRWPHDVTLFGCHPDVSPYVTGTPEWDYQECSLIGTSYRDMVFRFNDGCKKIMRVWTLCDWCSVGGHYNTWTHRQWIKISSGEVPDFECPKDITISADNCKTAHVNVEPWHVDSTACGGDFTITNTSKYAYKNGADISGIYPVGKTKVGLTVTFGCGMKRTCWVNVIVKNNKGPAPICLGSMTVSLMGMDTNDDGINDEGMFDIWAKDLNWKSFSPCGFNPLRFSFSPDSIQMFRRFTCDELGLNDVDMYVFDSHGNYSSCKVKVDVQNNGAHITPCERKVNKEEEPDTTIVQKYFSIAGQVLTSDRTPYHGLSINFTEIDTIQQLTSSFDTSIVTTLDSFVNYSGVVLWYNRVDTIIVENVDTSSAQLLSLSISSDSLGNFEFVDMARENMSYLIGAAPVNKSLENIDNDDLDALTEYIIGSRVFASPEEFVAADINEDGDVNLDDLSLLIDFIKGDITTFGANDWIVFYHRDIYDINPASVLKTRRDWVRYDNITASVKDIKFVVVQKGDLVQQKNDVGDGFNMRSTKSQKKDVEVFVSPNPFNDIINIEILEANKGNGELSLFDTTGKLLMSKKVSIDKSSQHIELDTDRIEESVIIYRIVLNGKVNTGKLVKFN